MKNGDQGQEGVLANRYGKFAETGSLDFAFLLIINYIKMTISNMKIMMKIASMYYMFAMAMCSSTEINILQILSPHTNYMK